MDELIPVRQPDGSVKQRPGYKCTACGKLLPQSWFRESDFTNWLATERTAPLNCRPCRNEMHEKGRAKAATTNPDKAYFKYLKKRYGLEEHVYMGQLKRQSGVCVICGDEPDETKPEKHLKVDMDKLDGKIMGLLCFNCMTFVNWARNGITRKGKDYVVDAMLYAIGGDAAP